MARKIGHGLLRLLVLLLRKDALGVYDYGRDFFSHLLPGEGFMNFGLWDRPLEEIAPPRRLAEFLLERAELQAGQRVLHVGSGLGTQDVLCCERYGCVVTGLDINPAHVRLAHEAAVARGVADRVRYVAGSGTALPAAVGHGFDRVLALECLDEMERRLDFFREAQRVLRPGGLLVVGDVYLKRAPIEADEWRYVRLAQRFWDLEEPLYTEADLRRDLRQVGFGVPEIVSIAYRVYRPLLEHLQRHSDYFFDLWPEFFRLVPGRMDDLFLNFGLWLEDDEVCPMQRFHLYVFDRAGIVPGDRILDVGSGLGGQDLLCYRLHGPVEIVGLEPSARHVDLCNRRASELGLAHAIRYVQGRAERLPANLHSGGFDKVFALNCLYHLERREDFFREAHACLKQDGSLIVVDQYLTRMPRGRIEQQAMEFDRRYFKAPQPYYTEDQFRDELRAAGLVVVSSESIVGKMLPPFYDFLRERRSELRALCRRLGYPTLLLEICLKGAKLMKLAIESGLYESAIVRARKRGPADG